MRFTKTFCAPGSVVAVVPAGLPLTLQYNQNGLLQSIEIGFKQVPGFKQTGDGIEGEKYTSLLQKVKGFVPAHISVTGGTTWVHGIMYSDRIPCKEGPLSVALYDSYIDDIINGGHYQFYAGHVSSLAASFQGPLVMRNFLSSNGFNMLPHIVVPLSMTDESLQMMTRVASFPFKEPFFAGFFIFEGTDCRYAASGLFQIEVTEEPESYISEDGYLKSEISTKFGETYTFNYSAILHHGVEKGCTLLIEPDLEGGAPSILATRLGESADKVLETADHDIQCPVCGKIYRAGSSDLPVQCDDPHCLSHEFPTVTKMLETLHLPTISYETYTSMISNHEILCITDVLETANYKDIEIKTTLAAAMYSVIPTSAAPNFDILERFANKCNNKIGTVVYYLQNPLRIEIDLDITDPMVRKLARWLEDPYNATTLTTIFARVVVDEKLQKFDGAPIFRGNKIAITGRFKRGEHPEIESILKSYAATVTTSIEPGESLPDVLLIGSLNDGVSGQLIQKAKAHNIPIAYEDDFFVRYEIDKDLAENLL